MKNSELKTLSNIFCDTTNYLIIDLLVSCAVAYFLNLFFGSLASFAVLLFLVLASIGGYRRICIRFNFKKYILYPTMFISFLTFVIFMIVQENITFKCKFFILLPYFVVSMWNYTYIISYRSRR
jgi:hypothetical protein